MSVMISEDKKNLIITCKCGCSAVHLTINHEDDEDDYAYQCFMKSNFYDEQNGMFGRLMDKLKKIWKIIRNKDYYYSDVVMNKEDFEQFKKWVNQF